MKTWSELSNRTNAVQKSVDNLLQKHKTLKTFRDAQEWDTDALAVIELLQEFLKDISNFRDEQKKKLDELKLERKEGSFFKKVFSSRSDENETVEYINKADAETQSILDGIDLLFAMMDKTPASKSEQKELANELRQLKKEYALQKREVNENLRQVRASARQKTANWTGVSAGLVGSVARHQRTSIRLEKERALAPNEDLKAVIEKNLVALERDLNWVMHFTGEDQEVTIPLALEEVRHCGYCGRRVTNDDFCLGCGAAI
jgi:hypothetical protein